LPFNNYRLCCGIAATAFDLAGYQSASQAKDNQTRGVTTKHAKTTQELRVHRQPKFKSWCKRSGLAVRVSTVQELSEKKVWRFLLFGEVSKRTGKASQSVGAEQEKTFATLA